MPNCSGWAMNVGTSSFEGVLSTPTSNRYLRASVSGALPDPAAMTFTENDSPCWYTLGLRAA